MQKGLLESSTPLTIAKTNANNKVVHNPPIGLNTREANANNEVPHTFQERPCTRRDPILL
jgi:hypothetical protein